MDQPTLAGASDLVPLRYHYELGEFLRRAEPEVWRFISEHRISRSEELRTDLLRSAYRIDRSGHPEVVAAAEAAASALGVSVPVSLYQVEGESQLNAMLVFVPEEAIVVLQGPVLDLLEPAELQALFGHELAHHRLWSIDGGDHLTTDRIISAMIADGALPVRVETGRRLSLATELFADRGALLACNDLHTAVATLLKIATALRTVSAASYLVQAEEVLSGNSASSEHESHPETFFRAAALRAWAEGEDASAVVERAIRGPIDIDRLDLVDQAALGRRTSDLVGEVRTAPELQTDVIGAHMSTLSSQGSSDAAMSDRPLAEATRRYLAYVLLDLATVDSEIEHTAVRPVAAVADKHGLGELFTEVATTELRLSAADRRELFTVPQ
jgi:hypothetical protein